MPAKNEVPVEVAGPPELLAATRASVEPADLRLLAELPLEVSEKSSSLEHVSGGHSLVRGNDSREDLGRFHGAKLRPRLPSAALARLGVMRVGGGALWRAPCLVHEETPSPT